MKDPISFYREQYTEKDFERRELFALLSSTFDITSCLYPGSFVHCTPSFYFPECCYVDSDTRAARFYKSAAVHAFAREQAVYRGEMHMRFHHQGYETDLPEAIGSFDHLVSLYAGFVSIHCTRYLKSGGLLLANNSHGDASMAHLDDSVEFVGAIHQRGKRCRLVTEGLEEYFIPKKALDITREYLLKLSRGIGYEKPANYYLFRKR